MSKNKKIKIGPFRCLYPTLATPKSFDGDEAKAKYSIKLLIPKADKAAVKAINDFVKAQVAGAEWKKSVKDQVVKTALDTDPYNDNCIVKDGDRLNERRKDEEKDPVSAYDDHYVVGINRPGSWGMPLVVGSDAKVLTGMEIAGEIQGGYWVNVQVQGYCYKAAKYGFTLRMLAVQKVKDDERFGVENPFDAIDTDDEEEEKDNPFSG